eukprot:14456585-Alexandrium_andersonii.AAC.1
MAASAQRRFAKWRPCQLPSTPSPESRRTSGSASRSATESRTWVAASAALGANKGIPCGVGRRWGVGC